MTVKEFIQRAMECKPMSDAAAQRILTRILILLGYAPPKALPEPKKEHP